MKELKLPDCSFSLTFNPQLLIQAWFSGHKLDVQPGLLDF